MKKEILRCLFIFLALFAIFLSGCKEVDKTYELNGIDKVNGSYIKYVSNDTDNVSLNSLITLPKKASVKFYLNETNTEIQNGSALLDEMDNIIKIVIEFEDKTTEEILVNIYRYRMFTIKFQTNCNVKVDELYVEENSIIEKPDVELTKNGYQFIGWNYNFNNPITKELTIEAKWRANSYTVTYDTDGGNIDYQNTVVTFGETYQLDVPTKEGFNFLGWTYNNKIINNEKWNINQDITVKAKWERIEMTYDIEYVIVGAVGPNLQRTYTNKEKVVLRTPYKCGYQFIGWYYEGDFSGERVYEIPAGTEGNLRLYSRWKAFNLEGAKLSILGDSISTFYAQDSKYNSYYTGNDQFYFPKYSSTVKTVTSTWWGKVLEETKMSLVCNESLSGSSCYNNGSSSNLSAMNENRISHLGDASVVIVMIGTNDNVNGFTESQFDKAYRTMLQRIKTQCKDAFVFVCTLGYSAYTGYNYTDARRIKYNTIIRNAAEDFDASVIEIAEIQTESTYSSYLGDNLHPNATGMAAYADKVITSIRNFVGVY